MKNRFQVVSTLTKEMRRFYKNEQGVYYMMMMLLSMPLLGLMAFAVDGSGMLLDKARLMQATEQAALALVAENNASRKNKEHEAFKRQQDKGGLTKAETDQFGEDTFSAMQNRRNQELLKGIVGLYLPQAKLDKDFSYQCGEEKIYHDENGEKINIAVKTVVACQVAGDISRSSWLYNENLNGLTFEKETTIHSGDIFVQKERNAVIPIDLVFVLDFSDSMVSTINGDRTDKTPAHERRVHILRDTVSEISNILFPKADDKESNASPFNRIGFVTFATYAQQKGSLDRVFPFYGKGRDAKVAVPDANFLKQYSESGGILEYYQDKCDIRIESNYRVKYCEARINTEKIVHKALEKNDTRVIQAVFDHYADISKTVNQIDKFDGKPQPYELIIDKDNKLPYSVYVINKEGYDRFNDPKKGNKPRGFTTAKDWFTRENPNIVEVLNNTELGTMTNISSGVIIGANFLMDINKDPAAQPRTLGSNTQRIMLMLSDGNDNMPTGSFIKKLLDAGLCERIKRRADSFQDKSLKQLPTKMAFVAFGYDPPAHLETAWKTCVGDKNYYIVKNKEALLEAFKQIISTDEEVGRATSKKPSFLK